MTGKPNNINTETASKNGAVPKQGLPEAEVISNNVIDSKGNTFEDGATEGEMNVKLTLKERIIKNQKILLALGAAAVVAIVAFNKMNSKDQPTPSVESDDSVQETNKAI